MLYYYDPTKSYRRNDFVRHEGEYYQSRNNIPPDSAPVGTDTTKYWRHWPDGYVRSKHMDDIKRMYKKYHNTGIKYNDQLVDDAWIQQKYESYTIMIKLVEKWLVRLDEKYVLMEDQAMNYALVEIRAQNFLEQTKHEINLIDNEFIVSNPLSADQSGFEIERRQNEMMVNIAITDELITLDGENTITVMGALTHQNPTIVLYKNRTYKFIVDSVGHGIEIVDGLGEDAKRLEGFVSGQGTEIGNIMLRTDTDEIHGEIPDVIYYRSVNDPLKTGKILVKDITHVEHYSTEFKGVTAYNIDISYNTRDQLQRLGWGVDIPDGANAWQYYTIYEYLSAENTEQEYVSNVIKWNDDQDQVLDLEGTTEGVTTIDYDYVKKYSDWSRDGGVSDIVIEKTLREGLGLFDGIDAIDRNYD